jgi:hypothetical protein
MPSSSSPVAALVGVPSAAFYAAEDGGSLFIRVLGRDGRSADRISCSDRVTSMTGAALRPASTCV